MVLEESEKEPQEVTPMLETCVVASYPVKEAKRKVRRPRLTRSLSVSTLDEPQCIELESDVVWNNEKERDPDVRVL